MTKFNYGRFRSENRSVALQLQRITMLRYDNDSLASTKDACNVLMIGHVGSFAEANNSFLVSLSEQLKPTFESPATLETYLPSSDSSKLTRYTKQGHLYLIADVLVQTVCLLFCLSLLMQGVPCCATDYLQQA
jgi:hypothetical protein